MGSARSVRKARSGSSRMVSVFRVPLSYWRSRQAIAMRALSESIGDSI